MIVNTSRAFKHSVYNSNKVVFLDTSSFVLKAVKFKRKCVSHSISKGI